MAYYLSKYKGKYRLKSAYDLSKNDFSRNEQGKIEENDVYIDCKKGMIYHFGRSTLVCYIPKLGTGRNILKALGQKLNVNIEDYTETKESKDGNTTKSYDYDNYYNELIKQSTIWDIEETDEEVLFKFKDKDIELIMEFMQPKTSGSGISPFSSKNLPKVKYEISLDEIQEYKNITSRLNKEDILIISQLTKEFISNIPKNYKEFRGKDMKSEQKKSCLKSKEFIHSIGLWVDYIEWLNKNIK